MEVWSNRLVLLTSALYAPGSIPGVAIWRYVISGFHQLRSCQNELQSKALKQYRFNNREADRQAKEAYLEEHKATRKLSGKYWLQATQTKLVWRMPGGCWLEYNENQTLSPQRKLRPEVYRASALSSVPVAIGLLPQMSHAKGLRGCTRTAAWAYLKWWWFLLLL